MCQSRYALPAPGLLLLALGGQISRDGSQPMTLNFPSFRISWTRSLKVLSANDIEDVLTQAVRRVAATTSRSRGRDFNPPESQGIELARRRLALASTPDEHRHWAEVLYRRKRAWARKVADFKFDKGALHMERSDKKLSGGTSFFLKPDGGKEHDVSNWPDLITRHFSNQFGENQGSAGQDEETSCTGVICPR